MNALKRVGVIAALIVAVPYAATAQTGEAGYRLGAEDQIEVQIYGTGGVTVRTRIKSDGSITLPLVGRVQAADQTTQALAANITAALKRGDVIRDPIVNVEIATYASRMVTMLGEFGSPGLLPLDRPLSLTEMVARVGGLRNGASDTVLLRHASGSTEQHNLAAIAKGEARDVALQSGDAVYAMGAPQYYIYGQIGNAGLYAILPQMTVRQALARAGGPTLAGSERKITLYRDGKEQDAELTALVQPNDVLFVRERVF
ncbi:Capsule polysaccharide export protein [Novosphingobium sp. 9U]|nr:Capsule polysaccharide export protein [Novosphingobium sp. 9U]